MIYNRIAVYCVNKMALFCKKKKKSLSPLYLFDYINSIVEMNNK